MLKAEDGRSVDGEGAPDRPLSRKFGAVQAGPADSDRVHHLWLTPIESGNSFAPCVSSVRAVLA